MPGMSVSRSQSLSDLFKAIDQGVRTKSLTSTRTFRTHHQRIRDVVERAEDEDEARAFRRDLDVDLLGRSRRAGSRWRYFFGRENMADLKTVLIAQIQRDDRAASRGTDAAINRNDAAINR